MEFHEPCKPSRAKTKSDRVIRRGERCGCLWDPGCYSSVAVVSRQPPLADLHVPHPGAHRQASGGSAARCGCITPAIRDPCICPEEEKGESARALARGLHLRRGGRSHAHTRRCGAARTLDLTSGPGREGGMCGTSQGGHQRCRGGAPSQASQAQRRCWTNISALVDHT